MGALPSLDSPSGSHAGGLLAAGPTAGQASVPAPQAAATAPPAHVRGSLPTGAVPVAQGPAPLEVTDLLKAALPAFEVGARALQATAWLATA